MARRRSRGRRMSGLRIQDRRQETPRPTGLRGCWQAPRPMTRFVCSRHVKGASRGLSPLGAVAGRRHLALHEQEAPPDLRPRSDSGAGGCKRARRRNPDDSGGVSRDMSYSRARVRRVVALPQVTALLLSLGLGFEVSVCPPGMDMGMEMPMPMDAAPRTAPEQGPGEDQGMDCPFSGSLDDEGRDPLGDRGGRRDGHLPERGRHLRLARLGHDHAAGRADRRHRQSLAG